MRLHPVLCQATSTAQPQQACPSHHAPKQAKSESTTYGAEKSANKATRHLRSGVKNGKLFGFPFTIEGTDLHLDRALYALRICILLL